MAPSEEINGAMDNNKRKSGGGKTMDDQLQQVFSLIVSRSRGEVGNDDVENAVSKLLGDSKPQEQDEIQQDMDDYDNLEEEPETKPPASSTSRKRKAAEATIESMRRDVQDDDEEDPLGQIPLGKAGARMMVTFGDGHKPKPEVVSAALLGTRQCLQVAIKDARALRRHQKEEFARAKKEINWSLPKPRGGQPTAAEQKQEAVGPEILYRAMTGHNKLGSDLKCGFDVEQLKYLFPEEMRAYFRWNQMHQAYQECSKEVTAEKNEKEAEKGPESNKDEEAEAPLAKGHLEERAAQFDARTEQMEEDWYLKFSEVRQGSFLPRTSGRKSDEERQWDASRKQQNGRGRPKDQAHWEKMSAPHIRFLHWVGFDPRSALPPPNEDTAEALAFLGYDFMGRIVEKAIYLRNVANNKSDENLLLELQEGEQLGRDDIEKALSDAEIRPISLFSSNDDDAPGLAVATQLYFGPGFEDRLEMEMDELAAGKKRKQLPPEEKEIRRREDELFSKLANAPVALDGFAQVLEDAEDAPGGGEA